MAIDESDMDYFRNTNTSPGPGAGRSIDPTKPGPDSILHELGECPAQSDAEPVAWQLVPKIPTEEMVEAHFAAHARAKTIFAEVPEIWKAMLDVAPAPPRPDAEPVAWQDTDLAGINITGLEASPHPDASAGLIEAAALERYAQSIAMWCYRENVTDHERLSFIANHPITRKYANGARAADRNAK